MKVEYKDGSFSYSDIRFIASDVTKNGFIIFPNPAKGQVQLYLNEYTQPAMMILYDNIGKKIEEQLINQQNSMIKLPASRGVYIVQISNADGSNKVRKKIVVQ